MFDLLHKHVVLPNGRTDYEAQQLAVINQNQNGRENLTGVFPNAPTTPSPGKAVCQVEATIKSETKGMV